MKIKGVFTIKQTRGGKVIRDFFTKNSLTVRGAIHLLATFMTTSATALQGNPIIASASDPLSDVNLRWIDNLNFVTLDRLDAIQYKDGGAVVVQADNRQWQLANLASPVLTWDANPAKGATSATFTGQTISGVTAEIRGIYVEYVRLNGGPFSCRAVLAETIFPVISVKNQDILDITYTLTITPTTA